MKIVRVEGREILDSRGMPTLECSLELSSGTVVRASVPSGASVGKYEALELRDTTSLRYAGKGVLEAKNNLELKIAPLLIGKTPDFIRLDEHIIDLDGTENKRNLGANATLAASIAVVRAQAVMQECEPFQLIAQHMDIITPVIPRCMFNLLNGGLHVDNGMRFQEFMVMPVGAVSFEQCLHDVTMVYQVLKKKLAQEDYTTGLGDEGGFAPLFTGKGIIKERMALDFLMRAIVDAGFDYEYMKICLDVAASCFYDEASSCYNLSGDIFSSEELVALYQDLVKNYPIYSIEDGMSQDDWYGWQMLTQSLGDKIQLVGDDLFVTNLSKIEKGISLGAANAVLIKPNQIGTISEAIQAIKLGNKSGFITVVSHRSGETTDDFVADFAVGAGANQFKSGACARGERVAKYNRLLEIEELLKKSNP
jgi:enolase